MNVQSLELEIKKFNNINLMKNKQFDKKKLMKG